MPPAGYCQPLEHLRDEYEKRYDERGEELGDGGGRDDRDRHRQLHRHALREKVLQRLLEDGPATDQQPYDSDQAKRSEWLPEAPPHGRCRNPHEGTSHHLWPFELVFVPLLVVVMLLVRLFVVAVCRRSGGAFQSLIGQI